MALERLLTEADLAELLSVSTRTIRRMKAKGELPAPKFITERKPRWMPKTIERWLEKRPTA